MNNMSSYQSITIVGRLGRDPEMKFLGNGTPVTAFSVATDYRYTSNGETVKETTWFRVSVFGKAAEACNKYLAKGSAVLVEGRLTPDKETGSPRIWQDKDGNSKTSFEIRANEVKFLDGNKGEKPEQASNTSEFVSDDDLPF